MGDKFLPRGKFIDTQYCYIYANEIALRVLMQNIMSTMESNNNVFSINQLHRVNILIKYLHT